MIVIVVSIALVNKNIAPLGKNIGNELFFFKYTVSLRRVSEALNLITKQPLSYSSGYPFLHQSVHFGW